MKCPWIESKALKKKVRGCFEYKTSKDNDVMMSRWNDNNIVTVTSNVTPAYPIRNVKRYSSKDKKQIFVTQPNIIHIYNDNMGGVHRCDQNLSLYRTSIRGKKWYFPLFTHCIDMVIENAWQLHRISGGNLNQLAFPRAVACGILETYNKDSRRFSKVSQMHHGSSRYDCLEHLAEFRKNQRRCGVYHKKIKVFCKKCDIALYFINLFWLVYYISEM
ncbi:hypothetical protein ILUMI_25141 [Ignelater luminosus]|uniref:PiggyBac transposable element-derived protein domain-containing protein n=1 Tax=Ignelater luminosus TaxID=2038154 RepID=A0A8K0C5Z1_IGNLU|nr:hypothetical protein ILUMI_25141 [Ignelater luminosus]